MNCETFRRRLEEFLDENTLVCGEKPEAFNRHLADCESCRKVYKELTGVMDELGKTEYRDPPDVYWDSFPGRVQARIDARLRRRLLTRIAGLSAAALVVLAVSAAVVLRAPEPQTAGITNHQENPSWDEFEEAIPETAQVEHLEEMLELYDGRQQSMVELVSEIDGLESVVADDASGWYEDGTSAFDLLDLLDLDAQKAVFDELSGELG